MKAIRVNGAGSAVGTAIHSLPRPVAGLITIPDAPGTGFEPDAGIVARYTVAA